MYSAFRKNIPEISGISFRQRGETAGAHSCGKTGLLNLRRNAPGMNDYSFLGVNLRPSFSAFSNSACAIAKSAIGTEEEEQDT